MARLNARSVKSKQNSVLRYVASSDIDKTASDLRVSTKQLNSFLRAKPETVRKHPERFSKLLAADAKVVARENDVKLVQRLSGQRLKSAYARRGENERLNRAVRLSNATRERRLILEGEKRIYRPINPTRVQASREQILTNMGGMTQKRILDLHGTGQITDGEAKNLMRKLYRNSGLSNTAADTAFEKAQ